MNGDDSEDDCEVTHVNKRYKREEEKDLEDSHFVSVYDVDNDIVHLEEQPGPSISLSSPSSPSNSNSNRILFIYKLMFILGCKLHICDVRVLVLYI